jgi:excisionase family DNA binding protein
MELLTEHEAALATKVSWWTIRQLIEKGKLRAANYGTGKRKFYRIDPADLLNVQPFVLVEPEPRRRRQRVIENTGPAYLGMKN